MSFYVETVKRKEGNRYRIVHDETNNGVRKRVYSPTLPRGTTKKQANKICDEMSHDAEVGIYIPGEPITLCEYAEQTYFPKYTVELSPTTQQHYWQLYNSAGGIKDKLGGRYLSEITTEVLQDMVNVYKNTGKAPKTIRNYVSLVNVILRMAKADHRIRRDTPNPSEYLKIPKMEYMEGNAYSMKEAMLMFDRAKASRNINMQLLLALTCLAGGLRRSELVALRWEDISLDKSNSYIEVRRAAVYANGKMNEKSTKTKAGKRVIPISSTGVVYEVLSDARRQYLKEQSQAKDFKGNNHVFILHHEPYSPVTANRLYKIYKRFLEKECPELPHYRLHDLRHTYFSWCTDIGFSDLSITATGGHSSIQSTKRYQHAMMDRMRADMEKLEDVFESVRQNA